MSRALTIGIGLATVVGLLATAAAQDRGPRIAFVRLDKVFNEYHKTKLADAQLKATAEEFNQERQKLLQELQAMQDAYTTLRDEALNTALSEEVRAQKRSLAEEKLMGIREQEGKIRRFDELRSKQLEDQSRRMRRTIIQEITDAVREYARAKGYDAVFDASGQTLNGVESVIFLHDKLDITAAVIEEINKNAPAANQPGS